MLIKSLSPGRSRAPNIIYITQYNQSNFAHQRVDTMCRTEFKHIRQQHRAIGKKSLVQCFLLDVVFFVAIYTDTAFIANFLNLFFHLLHALHTLKQHRFFLGKYKHDEAY